MATTGRAGATCFVGSGEGKGCGRRLAGSGKACVVLRAGLVARARETTGFFAFVRVRSVRRFAGAFELLRETGLGIRRAFFIARPFSKSLPSLKVAPTYPV
jgi:hypothetical protein